MQSPDLGIVTPLQPRLIDFITTMSNGSINGHANGNGNASVSAVPPVRSYDEDRNTKSQDV